MLTHYMCSKHRSELERDPKLALQAWFRMINTARYFTNNHHWVNAIKLYGNALDCAEIIFLEKPDSDAVNRFIRTAVEFLYVLRVTGQTQDIKILVNSITHKLEKGLYPANVQLLMRPVHDTVSAPLKDVGRWVAALLLADSNA